VDKVGEIGGVHGMSTNRPVTSRWPAP